MENQAQTPPVPWPSNGLFGLRPKGFFLKDRFYYVFLPQKAHLLALRLDHLCYDQALRFNPLLLSTYSDEDFIGKCKALAMKCSPSRLGFQCLERYSAYVCCKWLRRLTDA